MKQPKGENFRRRCCECRCWYTPAASAATTQMTCGKTCRLHRRAQQEKARRRDNLTDARAADRARQREHRQAMQATNTRKQPVSQAGLSSQAADLIEEIIEKMRHEQRLSQAGLRGQLHHLAQLVCGETEYARAKLET